MLYPEVVKQIWRVFGQAQGDLFVPQETSQCPLWFSLTHPAPPGLDAMVQTWTRLCLYAFPPIALLLGVLARVRWDRVHLLLVAPFWPGRVWFSDLISLLDGSPWEISSHRLGALSSTIGQSCGSCGCSRWGGTVHSFRSLNRGCWDHPWKFFTSWCGDHQLDPVNCPIGTVLEFLQARFSTELTHPPLKVYVAALSAYHVPLGGQSVGKHPLVTRFLRSGLKPPLRSRVPPWDLAGVLEALCRPPFKPFEEISDRHLTLKTFSGDIFS